MIREIASGIALLIVFALPHGQASTSIAIGGEYVDVGGSKIWYEECGSRTTGPGVVLLHDGLVHSVTWDDVWAPLCSKYHVLRYDRRGYGRSEPAKTSFVPEDDLLRILQIVHIDRAVIVGNSSGGGLALDFALAHPEMVTALFLIGPVVHGMASTDYFNERGSRNSAPLVHGDVRAAAENWSKDHFLIAGDDMPARKKLYNALVNTPQNLKVAGELEIRPSPPSAIRLSEIKVPTLVLVGDADIGDVFAYSGAIEAALPLASFEIWKDTGHLIQIQRPAELVARFDRFIALANRKEVSVSEAKLAEYVGHYKLFNSTTNVALREGHLILEVSGEPYYWLFAGSETKFFLRTEETEIEFQKGMDGIVTGITIHNNDGSVIQGPRTEVRGSPVAPHS
jgi:pimeloyl-ACP methyl ester carboxylesterase